MRQSRLVHGLLALLIAIAAFVPQVAWASAKNDEESMGREYSAEVEKDSKLITDPAVVERVERIGQAIAKVANESEIKATYGTSEIIKFKYQFKVIEDKDVNAFSLPGGITYVNSGLLDLVQSDDELAGVLAHEVAHAAHHHMVQLLRKQSSVDRYVALVALAGILGNMRSRDLNNLLMGAQMVKIGKLSGYTMEAEKDADRTAVMYMSKTQFNPEGLLTFMKKLELEHEKNPTQPLGIFQTHPAAFRRVASITKTMKDEGLNVDLRRLRDVAYAKPEPVAEGSDQYQVVISKKVLYTPAGLGAGKSSKERAETIANSINSALDAGITPKDIWNDTQTASLMAKDKPVISIEDADARANGVSREKLLSTARSALDYAVWADWLSNDCAEMEEKNAAEE